MGKCNRNLPLAPSKGGMWGRKREEMTNDEANMRLWHETQYNFGKV